MTKAMVTQAIEERLGKFFASNSEYATKEQIFKAVAMSIRDILLNKKSQFNKTVHTKNKKRVYYLCMEFLLGRNLKNNLSNLGLEEVYRNALKGMGFDLDDLYELEADPGLGNGGLGRLAACFMDSLASQDYSAIGFSLKYEFGLFRQKIVENSQVELPDSWLDSGEIWMVPRSDKSYKVKFGGYIKERFEGERMVVEHLDATEIEASPYDLMISGGGGDAVSVLRLWKAKSAATFDMQSFSQGDYFSAMRQEQEAEVICKILYPKDDHYAGKQLRLNQQYFLVSASIQNILKDHLRYYPSLDDLHEKAAIHINDTHPALAIPELMRLLMDEYCYSWDKAWEITTKTMAYTNHTVLAEALEKWGEDLIASRLPRIYAIIREINRRFCEFAKNCGVEYDRIERMAVISHNTIHMANLCVIGSHSVNGVSALHSKILTDSIFLDYYRIMPERFTNVTNGITTRRWLFQSNPRLSDLITGLIGEGCYRDASELSKLNAYLDDKSVLTALEEIKLQNKIRFSDYMAKKTGATIDPNSRFDVQIKRLHEYKRQLMNVLKIISLYLDLCDNPNMDITPQTFIFGAKAAPGYYHAKRIISLICNLSAEINKKPHIKDKLSVLFVENYNVTKAEILIPASEVSQQISLAGKEASGTSNMKFMLNGAITLGTLDGANVEIRESVGDDNIFIFGLTAEEVVETIKRGYFASYYYSANPKIKRAVDSLRTGFNGESFADIANYLVGASGLADPYMCQVDFDAYLRAHNDMDLAYSDKLRWNRMALKNIAESGRFSSDRSIREYCDRIWGLKR